jgi:hypothetical protein
MALGAAMNQESEQKSKHIWRFFRAGGFDQVRLETGEDLRDLKNLDQKLWVALSCPTRGLEFDTKTLDLIDLDKDGRIRASEILTAVSWTASALKTLDVLVEPGDALPLSAFDETSQEGRRLLASAKRILANLGRESSDAITPEDTADTVRIFSETHFNGDGIIPADAASDEPTRQVIRDIIACLGAETDRSGNPGISQEKLDAFFVEAEAFAAWWKMAESDPAILSFGPNTGQAFEALETVRSKIDDYFARCRLASYDPEAAGVLNPSASDYAAIATGNLLADAPEASGFPIARIEPGRPLPLKSGVNPAWAAAMARFTASLGSLSKDKETLTSDAWESLKSHFAPYAAWRAAKAGALVESLGAERVVAILGGGFKAKIQELIARDQAVAPEAEAIAEVDKLARFRRDLFALLNNFVSFRDFYTRRAKALFQAGTLYLDGRSCDLCIRVDDMAKHASLATLSRIYLVYCDCLRPKTGETMTIAAAFTAGDSDQIVIGRNGVFYDRKGNDWDATVIKIIEHPISIRQAFWAPYKKLGKMVGEQVEKVAAAKAKTVQEKMVVTAADPAKPPAPAPAPAPAHAQAQPAPPPPPPFDAGKFAGIFAAIGLALGAIGTAIASVVTGFLNLSWWQMPLALAGLMLVVSGPSLLIAYMKLRQRNLGPLLDANGWAVNARAKINIPFGASLTQVAKLPEGAERALTDPFAEKKQPWRLYTSIGVVIGVLLAVWFSGLGPKLLHMKAAKNAAPPPAVTQQK